MSQFNWTYLAPNGGKHNVGIFHGDKTGHVLVYVNSKVTLIDFKVKESKSYSIFIEEELCEINIEKKRIGYAYSFDINREADTPANLQRREQNKKHLRQGLGFVAGLLLCVAVAMFAFSYFDPDYQYERDMAAIAMAKKSEKETSAKIFVENQKEATYNFIANGKVYSSKTHLKKENIVLENGMPLEDGDEFIIQYSSKNPDKNEINFDRPTEDQIKKYKDRAFRKYLTYHPWDSEEKAKHIIEVAWELEQINGLAKIYLQDVSKQENAKFNSATYKQMVGSLIFRQNLEKRTQKSMM